MLTETQQGSNSGQSLTHDSDPRKLEFETVDFNDTTIESLGTNVDLTKAKALGTSVVGPTFGDLVGGSPIVGPTLNDLTGGTGNALRMYLQRAAKITDLTAGEYVCRMYFTDGTNIYESIFSLRMSDLLTLMAEQPLAASGSMIDITSLVADWVPWTNSHYFVTEFEYQSSVPFTGAGVIATNTLGKMFFGPNRNSVSAFYASDGGDSGFIKLMPDQSLIQDDAYTPVVPQVGDKLFLDFAVAGTGITGTYDFSIDIPLDAASVKGECNVQTLAKQSTYTNANIFNTALAPYTSSTYTFTGAIGMISEPYACTTPGVLPLDPSSQIHFSVYGGTGSYGPPEQLEVIVSNMTTTPPDYSNAYPQGSFQSFTGDQLANGAIDLLFDLRPESAASVVKIYGTDYDTNQTFQIDIATLQALATPEQLASQVVTFNIPITMGVPIYRVDACYLPMNAPAGLDNSSSFIKISFDDVNLTFAYQEDFISLPYNLETFDYPPITAQNLVVHFDLSPKSASSAMLCTKPYELRNRNNPAFRFHFIHDDPQPTSDKYLDVVALVSQGPIDGKLLWTKCPVLAFGNTYPIGRAFDMTVLSFPTTMAWLPKNWQGNILKMAEFATENGETANGAFVGPWNYIKFLLYNPGDESLQDYSNWRLEIIANAREL